MWQWNLWLLLGAILFAPMSAVAQSWHLPRLLPPQPGNEIAVYGIDTAPWGSLTGHWAVAADWHRSIARAFRFGPVALVPYLHPFVAPELPGFSLHTGWGADVGADLRFSDRWSLRGGVAFGGDESLGLGIVWNLSR